MYCPDLEIMGLNNGRLKLGCVVLLSMISHTQPKISIARASVYMYLTTCACSPKTSKVMWQCISFKKVLDGSVVKASASEL